MSVPTGLDDLAREPAFAGGRLLVVTGAGVSVASGIPTFRGSDPDAVWRHSDVSMATAETFRRDPVEQWRWYLERFAAIEGARPNATHDALVRLESLQARGGGAFLLMTQNIDGLHRRAGSRRLIEVHGRADRVRCSRPGCRNAAPSGSMARSEVDLGPFRESPSPSTLPTCPACGATLRAHVLFFDETYDEHRDYRFSEVLEAGESADLLIFAGTSFAVGVTDALLRIAALHAVPCYSIDPAASSRRLLGVTPIDRPSEVALPELTARLRAAAGPPL